VEGSCEHGNEPSGSRNFTFAVMIRLEAPISERE
jgi:hypothetical protein